MWRAASVFTFVYVFITAASAAESRGFLVTRLPDQRPSLLVLAMSHLHNPGKDAANLTNADVLAPQRQRELVDFVQQLASYKPTHIAIEHSADEQSKIDDQYADYRADRYELSRDEQDQIGFRLAKLLGLPKVHAVDWTGLPPGDRAAYDWNGFAVRSGQGDRLKALIAIAQQSVVPLTTQNIGEWILGLNVPEQLARSHRIYYDIALLGDEKDQPGAAWVSSWYGRNLRIFRNLASLADQPDQRVLVIFGQGHAHLLRQFAEESGAFRLRNVDEFVRAK